jgi:signal transduction histidine kinase
MSGMELVAEHWLSHNGRTTPALPTISRRICDPGRLAGCTLHPMIAQPYVSVAQVKGYCLPLIHQQAVVACLHLYLPDSYELSVDQIAVFNYSGPTVAIALSRALPQDTAQLQAAASRERERISRHLHDTLGQQLAYLQVKVNHLASADALRGLTDIQQDLGHHAG